MWAALEGGGEVGSCGGAAWVAEELGFCGEGAEEGEQGSAEEEGEGHSGDRLNVKAKKGGGVAIQYKM